MSKERGTTPMSSRPKGEISSFLLSFGGNQKRQKKTTFYIQ